MNILICGGRDFNNYGLMGGTLKPWFEIMFHRDEMKSDITIISGCAKGADTMAIEWAKEFNCRVLKFPADWDTHGKAAGHIRNQQMLDETPGGVDLVIAFPTKNSRGTWDMVRRAEKAGIKTIVVKEEE